MWFYSKCSCTLIYCYAFSTCFLVGQVLTEGRLTLEFTFDDLMRIRMWHFAVRQHIELIPRSVIAALQVCFIVSDIEIVPRSVIAALQVCFIVSDIELVPRSVIAALQVFTCISC